MSWRRFEDVLKTNKYLLGSYSSTIFINFNLLGYELDNFIFLYLVILYYIKAKNNAVSSCKKSKVVSFDFSIMKNIVVYPAQTDFPVKSICFIALGLDQALFDYLNLLISSYNAL